jgi:hypothetical protein
MVFRRNYTSCNSNLPTFRLRRGCSLTHLSVRLSAGREGKAHRSRRINCIAALHVQSRPARPHNDFARKPIWLEFRCVKLANLCLATALLRPSSGHTTHGLLFLHGDDRAFAKPASRRKAPMSSTLSSTRSRFSAGATKPSLDASLVSAGQKDVWFSIKEVLLDRRILLAIALLFAFCIGVAAALGWQFSRQVAPIPQTRPAPVALSSTLEEQFEAMSSGLAAVRQSIGELAEGLGQMRRDIANLQTSEQALFDKISELSARPAATGTTKPVPRPSRVPAVR